MNRLSFLKILPALLTVPLIVNSTPKTHPFLDYLVRDFKKNCPNKKGYFRGYDAYNSKKLEGIEKLNWKVTNYHEKGTINILYYQDYRIIYHKFNNLYRFTVSLK